MPRAVAETFGWFKRQALSYLLVVALHLAGGWLLAEYRSAVRLSTQADAASALVQQRRAAAGQARGAMTLADRALAAQLAVVRKARDAAQEELAARMRELEAHRSRHWPWAGLYGAAALAQGRLLEEQVAALRRTVRAAQERLDAAASLQQSAARLARLQQQSREQRAEAERLRAQWRALSAEHPFAQRFPWTRASSDLDHLKAQVERLQSEALDAEKKLAAVAQSPELSRWLGRRAAWDDALVAAQQAEAAQAALLQALEQSSWRRLQRQVSAFAADKSQVLLAAFFILAGAIVARLLVKMFLYFVVAPFASRRAPVRLMAPYEPRAFAQANTMAGPGRISAESVTLHLGAGEELLVRPEFIQSTHEGSTMRTAWLANPALPFTSLFAGLYLLTRVRADQGEALVLSGGQDPLDEVGIVELATGAALVCQPRSLAGLVQPLDRRIHISRHWRLGHLHAWLTMQVRFLVFHGPCRLVLKGRRGVRMEPAGDGRLVNRAATLGFDACVLYSSRRTETFVPYWLGKDDLFNDRFGGVDGSYLYEERPLDRRGNAVVGRGLEGLAEGVLRVFGI